MVGKPGGAPTVAPLQSLPVEQEPFSHIMIDCVGPLPKFNQGNEYLLTILDVATRYPEAISLRSIRVKTIVDHLLSSSPGRVCHVPTSLTEVLILLPNRISKSWLS